ncbi:hypothetical protein PG993_004544 [Apiospora rasikravindrae]|uniref:Uncharacterized protein n=1 Tax=Apiospora rasikravindrae TaxID=990691 RepID=A0ABR1TD07_9PEZI
MAKVRFETDAPVPPKQESEVPVPPKQEHDHGNDFAKQLNQEQTPPQPGVVFRAINGLLYQGSKAYVHTRYSKVGNAVAQEYLDTRSLLVNRYDRQRTYVGQLLLGLVDVVFSWRDWLLEFSIEWIDNIILFGIFLIDQVLATAWGLLCCLPLHKFVVYGSLVFGTRCFWALFWTFFLSQARLHTALTAVVYVVWATFVGVNYLVRPRDWDTATWPKGPWAIAQSMPGWYKSAVFWNAVGLGFIVWAQYKGFTWPLFPETSSV